MEGGCAAWIEFFLPWFDGPGRPISISISISWDVNDFFSFGQAKTRMYVSFNRMNETSFILMQPLSGVMI